MKLDTDFEIGSKLARNWLEIGSKVGHFEPFLVIFGHFWSFLANFGQIWAKFGPNFFPFWGQNLAQNGPEMAKNGPDPAPFGAKFGPKFTASLSCPDNFSRSATPV